MAPRLPPTRDHWRDGSFKEMNVSEVARESTFSRMRGVYDSAGDLGRKVVMRLKGGGRRPEWVGRELPPEERMDDRAKSLEDEAKRGMMKYDEMKENLLKSSSGTKKAIDNHEAKTESEEEDELKEVLLGPCSSMGIAAGYEVQAKLLMEAAEIRKTQGKHAMALVDLETAAEIYGFAIRTLEEAHLTEEDAKRIRRETCNGWRLIAINTLLTVSEGLVKDKPDLAAGKKQLAAQYLRELGNRRIVECDFPNALMYYERATTVYEDNSDLFKKALCQLRIAFILERIAGCDSDEIAKAWKYIRSAAETLMKSGFVRSRELNDAIERRDWQNIAGIANTLEQEIEAAGSAAWPS